MTRLVTVVKCILANLFLVVSARYVDDLFSLDEVGQPELALEFIGRLVRPHWRVEWIKCYLVGVGRWESRHRRECVRSAWLEVGYVDVSEMIFALRKTSSQVAVRDRRYLLSHCMLPSQAPKLAGKLS